jgi:hypothetical protein
MKDSFKLYYIQIALVKMHDPNIVVKIRMPFYQYHMDQWWS